MGTLTPVPPRLTRVMLLNTHGDATVVYVHKNTGVLAENED